MEDAHLFDFNAALMVDYEDEKARADLKEHGDAFRYQLVTALYLSDWAEKLVDPNDPIPGMDPLEVRAYGNALQEVAAYLRQGYFLPGGRLFEQVIGERQPPPAA